VQVTAHGMRGLHGTLAVERGATTHVVAQALGHESETTTRKSYIAREAITGADQRRVLTVLAGGRKHAELGRKATRSCGSSFDPSGKRVVGNPNPGRLNRAADVAVWGSLRRF
jgi:hypothetical protein